MRDIAEKVKILRRNTSEVLTIGQAEELLEEDRPLKGYIGVEPSGLFHVGWSIWTEKIKDLMQLGVEMTFLEATWHAWINDKLGGNLENIHKCAAYLEHCLTALGVETWKLKKIMAEELVNSSDYWALVVSVSKNLTLARVRRAMTIMGRKETDAELDFSKLIYPAMQVSDIFYLDLDIALGGMDQRRAHVLAREVCGKLGYKKPLAIHTPLLMGLAGLGRMDVDGVTESDLMDAKMSKSKPETCIFIHDSEEEIKEKVSNAFCPPKILEHNPVIELNRLILFSREGFELNIHRAKRYGGPISVTFDELQEQYRKGEIHPLDLKNATSDALAERFKPVRRYFSRSLEAQRLLDELRRVRPSR